MSITLSRKKTSISCCAAFLLLALAPAASALPRPSLSAPANGTTVEALPVFVWSPVAGADKYQFELAADAGFNSPVLGSGYGDFFTRNTRATLKKTVPNGALYWHVRAITQDGDVSPWSATRSIVKAWNTAPVPIFPGLGATLTYPAAPLRLTWSAVPRAFKYQISLASDPSLASQISGFPKETSATTLTYHPPDLAPGTYYWAATPLDAAGNPGQRSSVTSFNWAWPTTMVPALADLVAAPELYDPRFSWALVPGAARYQVEVNADEQFDAGAKKLDTTTIGDSLAPRGILENNTLYWRVRAIDADGNTGVWNAGNVFQKSFDDDTVLGHSSIQNLRMRNDLYPDASGVAGYQTTVPVISWDPVPGASSYEIEVGDSNGTSCDYNSPLRATTATTSWTPLGPNPAGAPLPGSFSADGPIAILPGAKYCAKVRARDRSDLSTGDGNAIVTGTFTDVDHSAGFAFDWTGYASGGACTPSCASGYLGQDDYLLPARASTIGSMPLIQWNAVSGAQSYYVVVARDAAFTTIVDYAFTRVPAYAPRLQASSTYNPNAPTITYADETASAGYYWIVLPSPNLNGAFAASTPLSNGNASSFRKQTPAPTLLAPTLSSTVSGQPSFMWTPVDGARYYEIQVDQNPTFATPIDVKKTNSTAYTSENTYPADALLYWRVRPYDDRPIALTWSEIGSFHRKLPQPAWDPGSPSQGATVPTWTWAPITGAVSYDIDAHKPDGSNQEFDDLRSAALTYSVFYGTGVFTQRIRANFPTSSITSVTHGPWSTVLAFTRTIPEPSRPTQTVTKTALSFSWDPRPEAKSYRVQVSRTRDFARPVENVVVDNTSYAPQMTTYGYLSGGSFFWRVAAMDEGRNVGDFTDVKTIALPKGMRVSAPARPVRGRRVPIKVTVTNYDRDGVSGARVRIWGAGITATVSKTNADGKVTFMVRARRLGKVYVRATKPGFRPEQLALKVR